VVLQYGRMIPADILKEPAWPVFVSTSNCDNKHMITLISQNAVILSARELMNVT
jgi:Icc-related predicted phosphoesterase